MSATASLDAYPVTEFILDGQVRSKSNYRHRSNGQSWSTLAAYEQLVHLHARSARAAGWPAPNPHTLAAERPTIVAALFAVTTLDIANVSKSVLDACEGALYVTDAQVRPIIQTGHRGTKDPHLIAAFAALPADVDLRTAHQVAAALGERVLDLHEDRTR